MANYGALKRSRSKVKAAYRRTKGRVPAERHVKIDVSVVRGYSYRGRAEYIARACLPRHSGRSRGVVRCGAGTPGDTPTEAIRKALRSLASKDALK